MANNRYILLDDAFHQLPRSSKFSIETGLSYFNNFRRFGFTALFCRMVLAALKDKKAVVAILVDSFADNKSVISITGGKQKRIKALMQYAFDICIANGFVYLSQDKKACALAVLPDKRQTGLKSVWQDVVLSVKGLGISNIQKALERERLVKEKQINGHVYHLWFIGVAREHQGMGKGSAMLKAVLKDAELKNRCLILETSTSENIAWHKRYGLKEYDDLDLGYRLSFLST